MGFIHDDSELKDYSLNKLRECFSPKTEVAYFESEEWIRFSAENLSLALPIKVEIYKAVRMLPINYSLRDSE